MRLAASDEIDGSERSAARSTPPITPTARVPPMVRKNIVLAVAIPRCSQATLVWTAMSSAVLASPMPMPKSAVVPRNAQIEGSREKNQGAVPPRP